VARKERYLVGLDIGTSKTTAIVAEPGDGQGLNIVGMGVAESNGIRRGLVVTSEYGVKAANDGPAPAQRRPCVR
jgi:cell division protein FtsA